MWKRYSDIQAGADIHLHANIQIQTNIHSYTLPYTQVNLCSVNALDVIHREPDFYGNFIYMVTFQIENCILPYVCKWRPEYPFCGGIFNPLSSICLPCTGEPTIKYGMCNSTNQYVTCRNQIYSEHSCNFSAWNYVANACVSPFAGPCFKCTYLN